ncbi:hypothetical protein ACVWXL_008979 [Bradyrhizobium sp. GM22.5]
MSTTPTTNPSEVWSGEETSLQQHPHHLTRGVGVWCGYKDSPSSLKAWDRTEPEKTGGEQAQLGARIGTA